MNRVVNCLQYGRVTAPELGGEKRSGENGGKNKGKRRMKKPNETRQGKAETEVEVDERSGGGGSESKAANGLDGILQRFEGST
jgi:hypothetical protein